MIRSHSKQSGFLISSMGTLVNEWDVIIFLASTCQSNHFSSSRNSYLAIPYSGPHVAFASLTTLILWSYFVYLGNLLICSLPNIMAIYDIK